jgi:hypothetical protein
LDREHFGYLREPFLAPGSDTSPGFYSQFSSTRTRPGSWNGHDNDGDDGNLDGLRAVNLAATPSNTGLGVRNSEH